MKFQGSIVGLVLVALLATVKPAGAEIQKIGYVDTARIFDQCR